VTGISILRQPAIKEGLRPVNLQTDLGQLADLIETVFANTMDAGGRAAVREMRQLSHTGLGMLAGLNSLAQGMSTGYVWVADGKIVGNVSVYPADYPHDMGRAWIIANVAVYSAYQGMGIATQLMRACLDMIQQRSSGRVILQVDMDNPSARHLYRKFGFVEERTWTQWERGAYRPIHLPEPVANPSFRVVGRRLGDAPHELRLARTVRPQSRGGVDWLRPTHINTFRLSPFKRLSNWLNLRDVQRLVVRDPNAPANLLGWLQIETAFGITRRHLLLMTHPADHGEIAAALVGSAVRRYGHEGVTLHHPYDDATVSRVLRDYQFTPARIVVHMRYDFR
jgi:ribosomal protein S18 acetylase RimI-like enzyme